MTLLFHIVIVASGLLSCGTPAPTERSVTARGEAAVEAPQKPPVVTVALTIYTAMYGQDAADAADSVNLLRRLASSCTEPVCDGALDLLREKDALLTSMAETNELPPPAFTFLAGSATASDRERVAAARRVVMLGVQGPVGPPYGTVTAAFLAARSLATDVKGLIFDPETLMIWRPEDLPLPDPDGPLHHESQVALGVLPVAEKFRVVTFGMRRYLLPDLVMEDVPSPSLSLACAMTTASAVKLAKERSLQKLTLIADEVRRAARQGAVFPEPAPGAKGAVTLALDPAERRASDPDNRLLKLLTPGEQPPGDPYERFAQELWGP